MHGQQIRRTSLEEFPEVLNAKDIAEYLGIGYVKALRLVKYGNIPNVRLGNTFRISKEVFKKWVNEPTKRAVLQSE